jgi:hypothetical protein
MMRRLGWRLLIIAGLTSAILSAAHAYNIGSNGAKWPGGVTTVYTNISGVSRSGISWADAMADAARQWNEKTDFTFNIVNEYRDPCFGYSSGQRPDYLNGSDFRTTQCGNTLPDTTLAVTLYFQEPNTLGSADIVEADIVFNANLSFDVYDGPLRNGSNGRAEFDFKRVALHELGHVLGLGHDNTRPAIMNARIGSLYELQQDDIDGVNTLYGGFNNCPNTALNFGWRNGQLAAGDCRVQQLIVGGSDTSFVDVYTLDITENKRLNIDMRRDGALHGVLLLADEKLKILSIAESRSGTCTPALQADVTPGRYIVMVNTYSSLGDVCAGLTNTGTYRLSVSYSTPGLLQLAGKQSFQGGVSNARFSGGVTRDGGKTFTNRVTPTQRFDVIGQIEIDPQHQGQAGFLVMAAITSEGETLVKNATGDFVAYRPDIEAVPVAERRVFGAIERLEVLKNFAAADINISSISVDFLIGYGLDSNPNELYFHQQAINLLVE